MSNFFNVSRIFSVLFYLCRFVAFKLVVVAVLVRVCFDRKVFNFGEIRANFCQFLCFYGV